jgi:enoyl-CoA hydratase/carnithine racemase
VELVLSVNFRIISPNAEYGIIEVMLTVFEGTTD